MKATAHFTLISALAVLPLLTAAGEADFARGYPAHSPVYTTPHPPAAKSTYHHNTATREKHSLGDGRITAAIKTKLLVSNDTAGRRIHVTTKNGVVTLSGTARSNHERMRAVQIARSVHGVRSVHSRLSVHA